MPNKFLSMMLSPKWTKVFTSGRKSLSRSFCFPCVRWVSKGIPCITASNHNRIIIFTTAIRQALVSKHFPYLIGRIQFRRGRRKGWQAYVTKPLKSLYCIPSSFIQHNNRVSSSCDFHRNMFPINKYLFHIDTWQYKAKSLVSEGAKSSKYINIFKLLLTNQSRARSLLCPTLASSWNQISTDSTVI